MTVRSLRNSELLRLLASPAYRNKTVAAATLALSSAAYIAARTASREEVPTADSRVRCMPPLWLDRLRASNVSSSLLEAEKVECAPHGRINVIAPPGLDSTIAEQLACILNRVVLACEEHANAVGYGGHLKGLTWNLIVRKCSVPDASTLDGVVFVNAGLIERLKEESGAWQAALAGVVSHELGHNLARHVLENQLDYLFFRWTLVFRFPLHFAKAAIAAQGLPDPDWVDRWHDQEVAALCRQREHEADELAVSILARAGFPPDSLAAALPMLEPRPGQAGSAWPDRLKAALAGWAGQKQLEKGVGGRTSQQASSEGGCGGPNTHPTTAERVERMRALAGSQQVQQLYCRHSLWTRWRLRWQ